MKRTFLALTIAICLMAASCRTGDPKQLNGRHRQPINSHAFVLPADAEAASPDIATAAVPSPQPEAPQATPSTPVCRVGAEKWQAAHSAAERVYRVFFDYGKTALEVPPEMRDELVIQARSAPRVLIKGRTDGKTFSDVDESIAMQRALAMRAYLIRHGVDATRIDLQFASAADYLADNSLDTGRSQNRRVEVVLAQSPLPSPAA